MACLTLSLVNPVSKETVRTLEWLLSEARQGKIRGLAFVAIKPRWAYSADVSGLAESNPTFTRGALAMFGQKLGKDICAESS